MKVTKIFAAVAAAAMVFALVGCSAPSTGGNTNNASSGSTPAASTSGRLNFVTGGSTGTYYAVGGVIANQVANNTSFAVTALEGNGSQANINALADNEDQFAFCQSDVMAYAYQGTNLFEKAGKVDSFSVVAALYDEQVQIVTTDASIKTVADLKGKRVSIGAAGSGVYFNAIDILGAYGITEKDITPTYQSFGDSADSLKNGQIDAAFIVAGAPTTAITDLSTSKQAYLVSLDDEHVNSLLKTSPYYSKATIKAGTYKGVDTDTITVAVNAVVLARNDVDAEAVYAMCSQIFNNLDTLKGQHAKFAEMSIEKASSITSVPYHAGAAKYFAEKGVTVPTK